MDRYDEQLLEKILSDENLSESELSDLVFEFELEKSYGDKHRWGTDVRSIVKVASRTFSVDWFEAATEMQEHEFYNQPVEVKRYAYEKTITVTEWRKI